MSTKGDNRKLDSDALIDLEFARRRRFDDWCANTVTACVIVVMVLAVVVPVAFGAQYVHRGIQYQHRVEAVPCQVRELFVNQTGGWLRLDVDGTPWTEQDPKVDTMSWFTLESRTCYRYRAQPSRVDVVSQSDMDTGVAMIVVPVSIVGLSLLVTAIKLWAGGTAFE